jgi:diaminopimelate decarboxylase
VRKTVFDGEDELYKLAKVNDALPAGSKLELLLRITTNDEKSVCSFSNKFGCPVA